MKEPIKREGTIYIRKVPASAGRCVGMCEYKGQILIACEKKIYFLSADNKMEPVKFRNKE